MKLPITCMQCLMENGKISDTIALIEFRDDGRYEFTCDNGHRMWQNSMPCRAPQPVLIGNPQNNSLNNIAAWQMIAIEKTIPPYRGKASGPAENSASH